MTANWSVQSDQSNVLNFKTSDLQVGKATGATTTFAMAHRMGLVKLNPTTKSVSNKLTYTYNKSDGTYTSSTSGSATITASNDFTVNKPYNSSGYWHIVKATAASTNTAMAFTCNTNQKDFWSEKSSGTDVGYGKYKTIDIQSDRTAANFEALFSYVGTCQTITLPWYDNYIMECWGAQGGNISSGGSYLNGGYGGYTRGTLTVQKNKVLYVYVGQAGSPGSKLRSFNGGGMAATTGNSCASGGGATDIRLVADGSNWFTPASLVTRIMVAGAGAGAERDYLAGAAGGLSSYDSRNLAANIATQIVGYRVGYGENADMGQTASGAGGGYCGGCTGGMIGYPTGTVGIGTPGYLSSAGGSSYISGHNGCKAILAWSSKSRTILDNYTHASVAEIYDDITSISNDGIYTYNSESYEFKNTKMIDGCGYSWTNIKGSLEQMPNTSGGKYASGSGHTGNGYAKITSQ